MDRNIVEVELSNGEARDGAVKASAVLVALARRGISSGRAQRASCKPLIWHG
jgi:hypothetical protein